MMEAVRAWLTSVVLSAFLISLIRILLPEGPLRQAGAFTCSLALMAAIARPLVGLEPEWPSASLKDYEDTITQRIEELYAEEARTFREQVAERTEELIVQQGADLGVTVSAAVTLRDDDDAPVPWAVTLSGPRNASLEAWLSDALDIPPERQFWSDDYSKSKSDSR